MRKTKLSGSITIRLSSSLEKRLVRASKARGQTPSELVRRLIEETAALDDRQLPTALDLLGDVVGSVSSKRVPAGRNTKKALASWGKDRRG